MWTMSLETFLKLDKMYAHQYLLREGLLRRWAPGMRTIFFSHQWRHSTHPDLDGAQLRTAQHQLRRLRSGAVKKVAPNWMQALAFPDDDTPTLTHTYWADLLNDPNTYVWLDYLSIFQPRVSNEAAQLAELHALDLVGSGGDAVEGFNPLRRRQSTLDALPEEEAKWRAPAAASAAEGLQILKDAVNSIPAYLERSELVMVIAPPLAHLERKNEICDARNWLQRGWCTLERVSQHLTTAGPIVMLTGESNLPELLLSNDWFQAAPGLGDFTCCSWGHADGSKCDRCEVGEQVELMVAERVRKLHSSAAAERATAAEKLEYRFVLCQLRGIFTGLRSPMKEKVIADARPADLDAWLKLFLFDTAGVLGSKEDEKSGWTPLRFAVLQDNAPIVRALIKALSEIENKRRSWLEAPLKKNHPAYLSPQGLTILHSACFQAGTEVMGLLLDEGASPDRTTNFPSKMSGVHLIATGSSFGGAVGGDDGPDGEWTATKLRWWRDRFGNDEMHRRTPGLFGETPLFILSAIGRGVDAAGAARFVLSCPLGEKGAKVKVKTGVKMTRCAVDVAQYVGATPMVNAAGINQTFTPQLLEAMLTCTPKPDVNQQQTPQGRGWRLAVKLCRGILRLQGAEKVPEALKRLAISEGCTALHTACTSGNLAAVAALLDAGADPSIKDRLGNTAADYAAGACAIGPFPELAELLSGGRPLQPMEV